MAKFLAGALRLLCFIIISVVFISCKVKTKEGQDIEKGVYLKRNFQSKNGNLNYRILYPKAFDPDKKHPVLLFMHGAGERGDDNEAQLLHGSELIAKEMNTYNSIAIFPQCPKEDYWVRLKEKNNPEEKYFTINVNEGPSEALGLVMELVEDLKTKTYIDTDKLYVAGLSMGGMATFDLLWRMPNTFNAAISICGAGSPEKAHDFFDTPLRIYHGEADAVVSVDNSKLIEDALRELGGKPEATYYPDVNHDSWTNAFAEPDFMSWLFAQK